jgi:hypothetical protein
MPIKCPNCLKGFNNSEKLSLHLQNCTESASAILQLEYKNNKEFICEKCGASFSKKVNLKRHAESVFTKCFIMDLAKQQKTINITNIDNKQITNIDKQINNTIVTPTIGFVKTGQEKIDHLTKEVLLKILNINSFRKVCIEFMKELYFNKKVPENHNWFIAYPNHGKAGIIYNYDTEQFVRTETEEIINEKFDNMMHLLQPLIEEIYKEDELNNNLTNVQRFNLQRFYALFGAYHLSNEAEDIYDAVHDLAYNYQSIPKNSWKEQGLDAKHLSIKF